MLANYFKVTLRTMRRHPGYSLIHILGLTVGLAACLLIYLYVQNELRYERHHQHAERLYRINLVAALGGSDINTANTAAPMAVALIQGFPEVENAVRFLDASSILVSTEDTRFHESAFAWTDASVFDLFTFPLLRGDPKTALGDPYTLVLSERAARKYFGNADPLGHTLRIENDADYRITGVMADPPGASRFQFDFLASFNTLDRSRSDIWLQNSLQTYVLLREGADAEHLNAGFPAFVRKYVAPQAEAALGQPFDEALEAGFKYGFHAEPLLDTYLHSDAIDAIGTTGDIAYIYILSAIALLVLLIACINFMNLATARSASRAREVGIRKVLGSERRALVSQFLGESLATVLLALLLALALAWAALPVFNTLSGKALTFDAGNVDFWLGLAAITLGAGLMAGIYPALVLSSFQPVCVLKGRLATNRRGVRMRRALVIAQFTISITLLVGAGIVNDQLDYLQTRRLGFAGEQVAVVPIETGEARDRYEAFRNELQQHPGVVNVGASGSVPGRFDNTSAFRPVESPEGTTYALEVTGVSYDFLETLDLELVAGRNFSREFATDADAYIINETAARAMGLDVESAPGTPFMEVGSTADDAEYGTIIGVVKDFHFESLHLPIRPLVFTMWPNHRYVSVRIRPDALAETLTFLETRWQAFEPGYPYRYFFLNDDFKRLYQKEYQLGRLIRAFTGFAVFVACLGLFGLAAFVTEQRRSEIGVRKVLGASVFSIVVLLSREFTRLVVVAALAAAPLAYLTASLWLNDFAYHTTIQGEVFVVGTLAALGLAWLTVSYQAIRAATTDPVKALRHP